MPHFDFSGLSLEVFLFPKILRAQNLLSSDLYLSCGRLFFHRRNPFE